jgi:outer membrane receptor protein involved in Fe transport
MFIWASQKLYPLPDSAAWPRIISGFVPSRTMARRLPAHSGKGLSGSRSSGGAPDKKRDWNVKKFLKKSALCSASCLQAVALVGVAAIGAAALSTPAAAQDYTSGALSGTVTDADGNTVQGATVTLTSQDHGFTRTTTTSGTGGFRFASLPTGSYTVTVASSGAPNFTATDVRVVAGDTASIAIALTGGGNEIVVTGAQIQVPFSGTTTGVNVDVEELVKRVPLGRDITSIALLAPGTTKGDTAFGNLASIGGSSVAENAYYINGLNITNFDNYLGSVEVPFDFYQTVEVKAGGYPAEFGRATGGIINAVSKSGSNEFEAAVHLNWAPDWARNNDKDLLTCDSNGTCVPYTNRGADSDESYSMTLEAGGPIIKDRLFVYGLFEMQKQDWTRVSRSSSLASHRTNTDPFWAVKVDAYPLLNHHLEFTIFDTRNTTRLENLAYLEADDGSYSFGSTQAAQDFNFGGVNFVGKYTGNFTDWLTLSAAYGRMRDRFDVVGVDAGAGAPYIINNTGDPLNGVPPDGLFTGQTTTLAESPYTTEREFYRADADVFFTAFGDHHVRFGFDQEENTLDHATVRTGGPVLCGNGFLSTEACATSNGGGASIIYQPGGQVEINYLVSGGGFTAKNRAFYLQDEWDVTDRLSFNLGVRRDDFRLNKQDGSAFLESKGNYAPRIGATYEVWPDHSGKIKAFYGQYFLPFASNTANRQASAEVYFSERWFYSGIDGDGLPILTTQTTSSGFDAPCLFGLTPGSSGASGPDVCQTTSRGEIPDTSAAVAHNLKATRETEWLLGYEHDLGDWNVGITYTHRNLDVTAEDSAIDAAAREYCYGQGIDPALCNKVWSGYHQYVINNPGSDLTVNLNATVGSTTIPELEGKEVTFAGEDLGYPKPKRKYDAVEFTFEHPWNGKWSLAGSYTWSKSRGNSEGYVQSDYGQDDSGITIDFDQPGFTDYAYGYLPNDRRHRFKLWGSYAVTDAFTLGAQAQASSPRHLSCFGYNPDFDSLENGYGAVSHYCGLEPSPRGTAQKSDWFTQVDLSGRYNFEIPTGQTVTLRVDVFNVFNSHAVMQRWETGDLSYDPVDEDDPSAGYILTPDPDFGQARAYQTPRYVRFGADITF